MTYWQRVQGINSKIKEEHRRGKGLESLETRAAQPSTVPGIEYAVNTYLNLGRGEERHRERRDGHEEKSWQGRRI